MGTQRSQKSPFHTYPRTHTCTHTRAHALTEAQPACPAVTPGSGWRIGKSRASASPSREPASSGGCRARRPPRRRAATPSRRAHVAGPGRGRDGGGAARGAGRWAFKGTGGAGRGGGSAGPTRAPGRPRPRPRPRPGSRRGPGPAPAPQAAPPPPPGGRSLLWPLWGRRRDARGGARRRKRAWPRPRELPRRPSREREPPRPHLPGVRGWRRSPGPRLPCAGWAFPPAHPARLPGARGRSASRPAPARRAPSPPSLSPGRP